MADTGGVAAERLQSFIERLERLSDEKQEVADQITDVFTELKGEGFDTRTIRELLRLRKLKPHDRAEREMLLDTYKAALGMLSDTPLGEAALRRVA